MGAQSEITADHEPYHVHRGEVGREERIHRAAGGQFSLIRILLGLSFAMKYGNGGWGGIRTPGAFRHTRFPGVHNRPLCHPSVKATSTVAVVYNRSICIRFGA